MDAELNKRWSNSFKVLTAMMATTAFASFGSKILSASTEFSLVCALLGLIIVLVLSFRSPNMAATTAAELVFLFSLLEGLGLGNLLDLSTSTRSGSTAFVYWSVLATAATATCYLVAKTAKSTFAPKHGFLFAGLSILGLTLLMAHLLPAPAPVLVLSPITAWLFIGYRLKDMQASIRNEKTAPIWVALSIYIDIGLFLGGCHAACRSAP